MDGEIVKVHRVCNVLSLQKSGVDSSCYSQFVSLMISVALCLPACLSVHLSACLVGCLFSHSVSVSAAASLLSPQGHGLSSSVQCQT